MDCKKLGIGLMTLLITSFLGITISEFFILKDISEIGIIEETLDDSPMKKVENCKPKDKDLKFQTLPNTHDDSRFIEYDKDQDLILVPIPAELEKNERKHKEMKTVKSEKKASTDLEKNKTDDVNYLPEKDSAEYKTLLYEGICREK